MATDTDDRVAMRWRVYQSSARTHLWGYEAWYTSYTGLIELTGEGFADKEAATDALSAFVSVCGVRLEE